MVRQTFFSFRSRKDNWRASIVKNSWVTQERKASGFVENAVLEEVEKKEDSEVEKWIYSQLAETSVTVVLIGSDTYGGKWIDYEIQNSHKKGNGMLGLYIHNLEDSDGVKSTKGKNPFTRWEFSYGEKLIQYPVYDWVKDDGYNNLTKWIEQAAIEVEKE